MSELILKYSKSIHIFKKRTRTSLFKKKLLIKDPRQKIKLFFTNLMKDPPLLNVLVVKKSNNCSTFKMMFWIRHLSEN